MVYFMGFEDLVTLTIVLLIVLTFIVLSVMDSIKKSFKNRRNK